ncbi:MAG TPA: hypothetical protein VI756_15920 [Blastocatellia bacterium]
MTVASRFWSFDRENVFYDTEAWRAILDPILSCNPEAVESTAWLFYEIIAQLEGGENGSVRVINTLKLGLECIYQYTDLYHLSFQAYLYSLEGLIAPRDRPDQIIFGLVDEAEALAATEDRRSNRAGKPRRRRPIHMR